MVKLGQNFLFGAAVSCFQVEKGVILDRQLLPKRSNHYIHDKSVTMMKNLGVDACHFSLSWSKMFSNDTTEVNNKCLEFYDKLIDELLANGIVPWVSLFDGELPAVLKARYGGWQTKEVSKKFADYTERVTKYYSDRIKNWVTINEVGYGADSSYSVNGFQLLNQHEVNQSIHNLLLGHGLAVQAIRANSHQDANIGFIYTMDTFYPVPDTEVNLLATREAWYDANTGILLPVLTGLYYERYYKLLELDSLCYDASDMQVISSTCDFIGLNYRRNRPVCVSDGKEYGSYDKKLNNLRSEHLNFRSEESLYSDTKLQKKLIASYYALKFIHELFPSLAIYIIENESQFTDCTIPGEEVVDLSRIEYLRDHFEILSNVKSLGMNLRGYFARSLIGSYSGEYYRQVVRAAKQVK